MLTELTYFLPHIPHLFCLPACVCVQIGLLVRTCLCLLTSFPSVKCLFACSQFFFPLYFFYVHVYLLAESVYCCLPSWKASVVLAVIMSCPTGTREPPCSAYYITELHTQREREKLVKNESNFRMRIIVAIPRFPSLHCCARSACFLKLTFFSWFSVYSRLQKHSVWLHCK